MSRFQLVSAELLSANRARTIRVDHLVGQGEALCEPHSVLNAVLRSEADQKKIEDEQKKIEDEQIDAAIEAYKAALSALTRNVWRFSAVRTPSY